MTDLDPADASDLPSSRPTNIRYLIVFVAMSAAILLYLERVCMSVAEVFIREDLRIDKSRMDLALGAFFFAYALGQVPSGWLSQRYGPRLMMTLYMIGWSVFGVFIAVAQDFTTLFAARFLLGLSQAGAYPTAAVIVKRWMPDHRRGLASSIVAFGGRFGGAGANWLTGILIVLFVPMSTPVTIETSTVLSSMKFGQGLITVPQGPLDTTHAALLDRAAELPMSEPQMQAGAVGGGIACLYTFTPKQIETAVNAVVDGPDLSVGRSVATPGTQELNELVASDGQEILATPAANRTPEQVHRLNRLLVEKVVPGSFVQLHTAGWRPTLLVYGVLGIFVGGLFWIFTRSWPREHPWANAAEIKYIESHQSKKGEANVPDSIPFGPLLSSRNQWLFSLMNFFSNFGWVFLITLAPRFLDERYHVPVDERGLMTTIPLLVAAFALIAGGWFTDRLTVMFGRKWGRSIPAGVFKLPCVIAFLLLPWIPSAWPAVVALTVMSLCQDFGNPAVWAFSQDTGGKQVGVVLGWANMWGNFGGAAGPIVIGSVAVAYGWDAALYLVAASFAFCGICGTLMNAAEPLFKDLPAPVSEGQTP